MAVRWSRMVSTVIGGGGHRVVILHGPVRARSPVIVNTWEDPLEEGLATCSSILAWSIPWTEEPWRATIQGAAESQIELS